VCGGASQVSAKKGFLKACGCLLLIQDLNWSSCDLISNFLLFTVWLFLGGGERVRVNQHPPANHPLDDHYDSVLWMNLN